MRTANIQIIILSVRQIRKRDSYNSHITSTLPPVRAPSFLTRHLPSNKNSPNYDLQSYKHLDTPALSTFNRQVKAKRD